VDLLRERGGGKNDSLRQRFHSSFSLAVVRLKKQIPHCVVAKAAAAPFVMTKQFTVIVKVL
jgi:hypothetical protein